MEKQITHYRIRLTVSVYREKKLVYKNSIVVPTVYQRRSEARAHIAKERKERLQNSDFFLSPRADYDLVRYQNEATLNTYISYRIVEERPWNAGSISQEQKKVVAGS